MNGIMFCFKYLVPLSVFFNTLFQGLSQATQTLKHEQSAPFQCKTELYLKKTPALSVIFQEQNDAYKHFGLDTTISEKREIGIYNYDVKNDIRIATNVTQPTMCNKFLTANTENETVVICYNCPESASAIEIYTYDGLKFDEHPSFLIQIQDPFQLISFQNEVYFATYNKASCFIYKWSGSSFDIWQEFSYENAHVNSIYVIAEASTMYLAVLTTTNHHELHQQCLLYHYDFDAEVLELQHNLHVRNGSSVEIFSTQFNNKLDYMLQIQGLENVTIYKIGKRLLFIQEIIADKAGSYQEDTTYLLTQKGNSISVYYYNGWQFFEMHVDHSGIDLTNSKSIELDGDQLIVTYENNQTIFYKVKCTSTKERSNHEPENLTEAYSVSRRLSEIKTEEYTLAVHRYVLFSPAVLKGFSHSDIGQVFTEKMKINNEIILDDDKIEYLESVIKILISQKRITDKLLEHIRNKSNT